MIKYSIYSEVERRILVLDGGLGTMVQGYRLTEEDYRGEEFAQSAIPLKGCNDLLVLTAPDVISRIHEAYLLAGADIISTDSFNANSISLADYGLETQAYRISRASAKLARAQADKYTLENPSKPRFVAGSMGPTNRTASMSADVNNPASREVTFTQLVEAYGEQAKGLIDGGADILLVETIFDTLNAKAALFAIDSECERRGVAIPIMVSGTLADASGRTLSGQTVEAMYTSLSNGRLLSIGLNCAYGARQMKPYLERLAAISDVRISAHPNAGLPNVMGGYDETPQMMAADVEEYMKEGLINIIGGCCGTTPVHIVAISRIASKYKPRAVPKPKHETTLSGLEPLKITAQSNFINIGERSNVAGSAKFARLIREQNYEEAISIAREQVDSGAQIVDVCMDDGLIDGVEAMRCFLNMMMSEPEISRVPVMIDSSSWDVLEAGLQCVQGKCIVNSISLKEGEEEFVRKAKLIHRYGAAAVVMLFDEKGQADSFERKTEVAKRAYDTLVDAGFPAEDIVFDPNVLAVATGIDDHNNYGVAFIEACRWIKDNLPYSKVSGGVSNLSFSFRGNNTVREAMHSVFLYHAISAGMDMGIVNPAMLQIYSDIEPRLLELTEDVVLNRRTDTTERLTEYAEQIKSSGQTTGEKEKQSEELWHNKPLAERIDHAMLRGITEHIEADTMEAYNLIGTPLGVIDTLMMPAMSKVGELFGQGKMFLPQVVKSARVMKKAVDVLTPYIKGDINGEIASAGKILIATVKGDVHDIGKNIVSVVMACNGYRIEDLGVMVECNTIVDRAVEWGTDVIGLSGLITPSLEEMTKVVSELEKRGLKIPVIIGGATTSAIHTAVKIAPHYSGVVLHSRDASDNIRILGELFGAGREQFIADIFEKQTNLRAGYDIQLAKRQLLTLAKAQANSQIKSEEQIVAPKQVGRIVFKEFPISEVVKYIDWNFFFPAWGIKGRFPEVLDSKEKGEEAQKLHTDAKALLERIAKEKLLTLSGVVGIYRATREGDDIVVKDEHGEEFRLAQLRNQEVGKDGSTATNISLADYVAPADDYIGAFAITGGIGLEKLSSDFRTQGDDYNAIMSKLLADRLAEAFAEAVHTLVREVLWGYQPKDELSPAQIINGDYQGVRVAFGYPACPDHSLKQDVFNLLRVSDDTPMTITENYMIIPGESICGLIFADKDSKYFSVGKIDRDQIEDYARRRGMSVEEISRIIPQHI